MEKDFGPEATPIEHDSSTFPESRPRKDEFSDLPEVNHEAYAPEVLKGQGEDGEAKVELSGEVPKRERFLCGMRRSMAILLMIALVVVVIVIAGSVGGVLGSRSRSARFEANHPDSSSPSTAPSPPTTANTTVPAPGAIRSVFAAQGSGAIVDIWQRADTALYIRIYNRLVDGTGSQKWGDPFPLDMDGAAMNTTPVAATTVKTNDTFEVRVHYVARDPEMLTSLIFRCNVTSCAKPSSNPIPSLPAPSAGSGLALIAPGPGLRRQYFVNNDSFISEATLAPNTDWSTPQAISNKVKAHRASPVAATMVNSDIWVFWFNEAKILQVSSSVWKTGIWSVVQNITAPIPAQLPRALGVAVSEKPTLTIQLFFHDGTKIQHVRFASGQWMTAESGSAIPDASISNGPLGVVGWNDTQVRMYYPVAGGKSIKEVASSGNSAWVTGKEWGDDYD